VPTIDDLDETTARVGPTYRDELDDEGGAA
jgi:hypothetical protein